MDPRNPSLNNVLRPRNPKPKTTFSPAEEWFQANRPGLQKFCGLEMRVGLIWGLHGLNRVWGHVLP